MLGIEYDQSTEIKRKVVYSKERELLFEFLPDCAFAAASRAASLSLRSFSNLASSSSFDSASTNSVERET